MLSQYKGISTYSEVEQRFELSNKHNRSKPKISGSRSVLKPTTFTLATNSFIPFAIVVALAIPKIVVADGCVKIGHTHQAMFLALLFMRH